MVITIKGDVNFHKLTVGHPQWNGDAQHIFSKSPRVVFDECDVILVVGFSAHTLDCSGIDLSQFRKIQHRTRDGFPICKRLTNGCDVTAIVDVVRTGWIQIIGRRQGLPSHCITEVGLIDAVCQSCGGHKAGTQQRQSDCVGRLFHLLGV